MPRREHVRSRISGFTLIELIITILVMTILLGIGVPSYLQFKEDNILLGAAQSLYSDIQLARSEAVKRDTNEVAVRFFDLDGEWCYRVSDDTACNSCDSNACDIHDDGIIRGVGQSDFPNVTIDVNTASSGEATIPVQARRTTMSAANMTFTYGSTTKKVIVSTNLLGRASICTPSTSSGLTGVDQCP